MTGIKIIPLKLRAAMLRVNGYLVFDAETGEALMVDPAGNAEAVLREVDERKLKLKYIVLTHGHFDHIMCTAELKRKTGVPVCMNKADEPMIRDSDLNAVNFCKIDAIEPFDIDIYLRESDRLFLGSNYLSVIETPGHTPGEISLYTPGFLICGDTILRGTTGRMDLAGADVKLAINVIKEKIFTLPNDTIIYAGHYDATDVGYEKAHNDTVK